MPVDPRTSASAPADMEPALRYAETFNTFNLQAGNFLEYLSHGHRLLPSELNDFATALNAHRDEVFARNDADADETKRGVYVAAARMGFDLYDSEFQSWLNSFSYNAFRLAVAEAELRGA